MCPKFKPLNQKQLSNAFAYYWHNFISSIKSTQKSLENLRILKKKNIFTYFSLDIFLVVGTYIRLRSFLVKLDHVHFDDTKENNQVTEAADDSLKGLVTHSDILKIYRIIQYSKGIFKCNMVKNIFKMYKKITFLLKKVFSV